MTAPAVIELHRRLSPSEATLLVGTPVDEPVTQPIDSPRSPEQAVHVRDADTGELIAMVTKLPRDRAAALRRAALGVQMEQVGRLSGIMAGGGRTFGWQPPRVIAGRESCRAALAAVSHPTEHQVLASMGGDLADEFARQYPEQATTDRATLAAAVKPDWMLDDRSLWTSGVINHSATLPYHRDAANFRTWSAMPTLRYGMAGGMLYAPEYDLLFPCRDGDVTWFCGRDLVHGVTPMAMKHAEAYRYSIVYYALRGLKNCRTLAEETTQAAARRTERERRMAAEVRAKLAEAQGTP